MNLNSGKSYRPAGQAVLPAVWPAAGGAGLSYGKPSDGKFSDGKFSDGKPCSRIVTATSCGHTAALLLKHARTFKVLAVYKRSVYLLACLPRKPQTTAIDLPAAVSHNRILCINASVLGNGPLQLTIDRFDLFNHHLKPGLRILNDIESATLRLRARHGLDYRRALQTQLAQPRVYLKKPAQASDLYDLVSGLQQRGTFRDLLPSLLCAATTSSAKNKVSSGTAADDVRDGLFTSSINYLLNHTALHHRGWSNRKWAEFAGLDTSTSLSQRVAAATPAGTDRTNKQTASGQHIDGLSGMLGRGSGLTPAGDDFICGVFMALHLLQQPQQIQALRQVLEPQIALRTHEISAAHLHEAMSGYVTDRSFSVVEALIELFELQQETTRALPEDQSLASETDTTVSEAVNRVAIACNAIGASSGWDFLAGVLTTLHAQTL